ncbi:MAG: radical SAM protein [Paludibacteraceae bacterium]|nr:radical SAM protein [Paludibacteraceae bacterium]MBO7316979.1 radical SAM protein [Paludibacteraceae bacterium]
MLFEKIVFGPIKSRRLGTSLGVNLLPKGNKICTFNCIYCECGFNSINIKEAKYPTVEEVKFALESRLNEMQQNNEGLDTITFAGDGEPTMNPFFLEIIEETIRLRDFYFPLAKISVLSNATMLNNERVFEALKMVDNNILKLDSVNEETVKIINQPTNPNFSIEKTIDTLSKFNGKLTIQTLFFSGVFNGKHFDNTTEDEVSAWLSVLKRICPKSVQIYSLDRKTPAEGLQKASKEKLQEIGERVRTLGFETIVVE